jgi:ribosome biogenesis GTPase
MNNEILKGLVIRGSRNIMTVRIDTDEGTKELECRIKGKILKGHENVYNPIAPGDYVTIERKINSNTAMILGVEERLNLFSRFNQKGGNSQLLAANVDLVLCLCTPVSPPFRPRFLDRVLLQADIAGINSIVICNKIDLEYDDIDVDERLEEYKQIGYKVMRVSAKTGEGIEDLKKEITGKTCVLTGQSGVGKSSIINALSPGLCLKEGELNEKYDRGVHTTTMSIMYELNNKSRIIDTPGVRRFIPDGIEANDVINYLREFAPLAAQCSFGLSCSHRTAPTAERAAASDGSRAVRGCKIMEAVYAGVIHEDRYESFLRIMDDLNGKENDD